MSTLYVDFYYNSHSCFFYANVYEIKKDGRLIVHPHVRTTADSGGRGANLPSTWCGWDMQSKWPFMCWIQSEGDTVFFLNQIQVCPRCLVIHGTTMSDLEATPTWAATKEIVVSAKKHLVPFTSRAHDKSYLKWCSTNAVVQRKRLSEQFGEFVPARKLFERPVKPESTPTVGAGIYCLKSGEFVKVGMSTKSAASRARSQLIPMVSLEWIMPTPEPKAAEATAHKILGSTGKSCGKSEWFQWDGDTSELKKQIQQTISCS